MDNSTFRQLIEKHLSGSLNAAELEELKVLLRDPQNAALLDQLMDQQLTASTITQQDFPQVVERISAQLQTALKEPESARIYFIRKWWWAAASVLLVMGLGAYLLFNSHKTSSTLATTKPVPVKNDVLPGKDGAVLTLADGRKVVLDSLGNGIIATQNGSRVILSDGHITYDAANEIAGPVVYNTMTTPKGRQFHLMLPDGSKVWLNAASSITYPVAFTAKNRKVTISGEVYFEVAKNAAKPFLVDIDGRAFVQVLGTNFNINSYTNEGSITTTLLVGSVKVVHKESAVLQPGQQAVLTKDSPLTIQNNVDIARVMAWKNGLFDFEGADVETVMRKLERWYDITVRYEGPIPKKYFRGQLDRGVNLSEIIKILPELGIQCRLEGRTLIVY